MTSRALLPRAESAQNRVLWPLQRLGQRRIGPTTVRYAVRTIVAAAVVVLALGHILFGLTNFQPGFPWLEGAVAVLAGLALLASLVASRFSVRAALWIALLGTLPLVAWFAYAVPVDGSSDPQFLVVSLIVPAAAGTALLLDAGHRRVPPWGGA